MYVWFVEEYTETDKIFRGIYSTEKKAMSFVNLITDDKETEVTIIGEFAKMVKAWSKETPSHWTTYFIQKELVV